jgi:hypothetical protein
VQNSWLSELGVLASPGLPESPALSSSRGAGFITDPHVEVGMKD